MKTLFRCLWGACLLCGLGSQQIYAAGGSEPPPEEATHYELNGVTGMLPSAMSQDDVVALNMQGETITHLACVLPMGDSTGKFVRSFSIADWTLIATAFPNLKTLSIKNLEISMAGMDEAFEPLHNLEHLKELEWIRCLFLSEGHFLRNCARLPYVDTIRLIGCPGMNKEELDALAIRKTWKRVEIDFQSFKSDLKIKHFEAFIKEQPELEFARFNGKEYDAKALNKLRNPRTTFLRLPSKKK